MSEQSMIEKVARALCSETYADDRVAVGMEPGTVAMWTLYIPEARAAIEAMRESTDALNRAAVEFANGPAVYKYVSGEALKIEESIYAEAYRAMIDAALKDTP